MHAALVTEALKVYRSRTARAITVIVVLGIALICAGVVVINVFSKSVGH